VNFIRPSTFNIIINYNANILNGHIVLTLGIWFSTKTDPSFDRFWFQFFKSTLARPKTETFRKVLTVKTNYKDC
jgi:hypothetical protein